MNDQETVDAIKAQIVKAESDSHTWQVAEDEEKYLDAYDRTEALELQLDQQIKSGTLNSDTDHDPETHAHLIMLSNFGGALISAIDGQIGHIKTALFDDESWTIRYIVVDTGNWLSKHEVLISPYSIKQPLIIDKNIEIKLTRLQLKNSPDVDTHQPVSRQHERQFLTYYSFPTYWGGGDRWGEGSYPLMSIERPLLDEIAGDKMEEREKFESEDIHLRSCAEIIGYDLQTSDDSIGHIKDFIFDEASWAIRYLIIDTRNWLPGGRKVLIATHWIENIDWSTRNVYVKLTKEQVKNSPDFDDQLTMDRDYESRLHASYNRSGYWI